MDHGHATAQALPQQVHHDSKQGQQHPLGIYFVIWGLLFVLSTFSYGVDYFGFHGLFRISFKKKTYFPVSDFQDNGIVIGIV